MSQDGYRAGYGQCRADLLLFIKEAMREIQAADHDAHVWSDNPDVLRKQLRLRLEELKRIRAYVKVMKPKENSSK